MKRIPFLFFLLLVALVALPACKQSESAADAVPGAHTIRYRGDFDRPLGVQLYTYREMAKTDPIGMLATARKAGFTYVETAGMYNMKAPEFAEALKKAGLKAVAMHVGYDQFKNNPQQVVADAKALGATYVGIPWYPHTAGKFDEATARKMIADFNSFGKTMKDAGLKFFYHNHGYEPHPYGNETLLDLIIRETDPALVSFEMDVLWTWMPNVDPAAIIKKYPGRFKLMHIKDAQPSVQRGSLSGGMPGSQESVIGQGQVDWAELLEAAEKDGMEYYFVEDESPDPINNVPKSIAYLENVKY